MPGGGGGGGGGEVKTPIVPTAGPPRAVGSYPQYTPLAYQGMQPGGMPPMGGQGAPMQSHMPAINGQMGFGGIPAGALIQALMAGYAGVPSATQAPGAGGTTAPGPMQMSVPTPPAAGGNGRRGRGRQTPEQAAADWHQAIAGNGPTRGRSDGYTEADQTDLWLQQMGGEGAGPSAGHDFGGYGGSTDSSNNGFSRGGLVKKAHLAAPNPAGPDDGHAALDEGEYVVRASQAKRHGPLLRKINNGKFGNTNAKG